MEKIFGYKGLDEKFYKTKKKCEEANLNFEIKEKYNLLKSFQNEMEEIVLRYENISDRKKDKNYLKIMLECHFVYIFKNLDRLLKIREDSRKLQKIKSNWWWLKHKWW